MASNIQRGTRGLSAGDWVRLQRLRGSRNFQTDKPGDITNPEARSEPESGRRVYTEFGTSKIRRPASGYTDFIASQTADYVIQTPIGTCGVSRNLTIKRICDCRTSSAKKVGICPTCRS
jgi:hypothetical protein